MNNTFLSCQCEGYLTSNSPFSPTISESSREVRTNGLGPFPIVPCYRVNNPA